MPDQGLWVQNPCPQVSDVKDLYFARVQPEDTGQYLTSMQCSKHAFLNYWTRTRLVEILSSYSDCGCHAEGVAPHQAISMALILHPRQMREANLQLHPKDLKTFTRGAFYRVRSAMLDDAERAPGGKDYPDFQPLVRLISYIVATILNHPDISNPKFALQDGV